jgi:hypothetical protein
MLQISPANMPLLVSALQNALAYQEGLLRSDTLRNREDYEEFHLQLSQFYEHVKEEYRRMEAEIRLPLSAIAPEERAAPR